MKTRRPVFTVVGAARKHPAPQQDGTLPTAAAREEGGASESHAGSSRAHEWPNPEASAVTAGRGRMEDQPDLLSWAAGLL
jgi:hypothetical protein